MKIPRRNFYEKRNRNLISPPNESFEVPIEEVVEVLVSSLFEISLVLKGIRGGGGGWFGTTA